MTIEKYGKGARRPLKKPNYVDGPRDGEGGRRPYGSVTGFLVIACHRLFQESSRRLVSNGVR